MQRDHITRSLLSYCHTVHKKRGFQQNATLYCLILNRGLDLRHIAVLKAENEKIQLSVDRDGVMGDRWSIGAVLSPFMDATNTECAVSQLSNDYFLVNECKNHR